MSGWYVHCAGCGAQVFMSRRKWTAEIKLWWIRLWDDDGTFIHCLDSPRKSVTLIHIGTEPSNDQP